MRLRFVNVSLMLAAVAAAQTLGLQPSVHNVREDRATISWTTIDGAGNGVVRYSPDGSFSLTASSKTQHLVPADTGLPYECWLHRADLTALKADTAYLYRVFLDGKNMTPAASAGDELKFRTTGQGALRFLALGDSGDGAPAQRGLAQSMEVENAVLVLHTGDLAYENGTFLQLQEYFFNVYRHLMSRVPFFTVPGNHDYGSGQALAYRTLLTLPEENVPPEGRGLYYSFDEGPVHFTALDSNFPLLLAAQGQGAMLDWLERDLEGARSQWRIVYFHHTPFPTGHHRDDPACALARDLITPILERHGVHLVLSGHEHVYQRTKARRNGTFTDAGWGTVYVTTGGGGYSLQEAGTDTFVVKGVSMMHYVRADIEGSRMTVRAIGDTGQTIDEFELSAAAALEPGGVLDAASFQAAVAPGGLISLFGKDLARVGSARSATPFPFRLGEVGVTANGVALPLLFVSRSQINAQLPFDLAGAVRLAIDGPNGSASAAFQVADTAPSIFSIGPLPAVIHADGRLVSETAPAVPGEWLAVFLTGLGKVAGTISAGQAAPMSPLMTALVPVQVEAGGRDSIVAFAGLAPGLAGVNQVNFRAPDSLTGPVSLRIRAGAAISRPVTLLIAPD